MPAATCQWYALCRNTATTTRTHVVLGRLSICAACDAKASARRGAR